MAAVKNLEDQPWYHGLRPRQDILSLLNQPGEWLVRTTDSREIPEIIISLRNDKLEYSHLTLKFEHSKWALGAISKRKHCPKFDSVVDLVEYYQIEFINTIFQKHDLPGHLKMTKPIYRPKWLIKHAACKFNIQKDMIGAGNFCKVYKGTYERDVNDEVQVAIKICHGASTTFTEESKKARESMIHEAHLMSYYVHKHVIQLYGVACDHYPVMIVMEFCPGGNLQEHLERYKDKIEVNELMCYAAETSRGMRYLHSKSCVHRDLAARNCLISEAGLIKISDFGLSKIAEEFNTAKKDQDEEPPLEQIPLRWMAPECLKRPQLWSLKSDVWSFGVLLYEIFNEGKKPWPDDPPKKIATLIRRRKMPDYPPKTPPPVRELMEKIWSLDVDKRPTMEEINKSIKTMRKAYKIMDPTKTFIKRYCTTTKSKTETYVANSIAAQDESEESLRTNKSSMRPVE